MSNTWLIRGRYYGYPECCIQSFLNLDHLSDPEPRKLKGTGYVPCKACNKKSEKKLIETIQSMRRALVPFPKGGRKGDPNINGDSHLKSIIEGLK